MRAELDKCLGEEYMERYEQKKVETKEFHKRQAQSLKDLEKTRTEAIASREGTSS
jgi:hypothetical protein